MITIFVEGGLVQAVVDTKRARPTRGIAYDVVDYDVLKQSPASEVRDYFQSLSTATVKYMKKHLPDEYARFIEYCKDGGDQ